MAQTGQRACNAFGFPFRCAAPMPMCATQHSNDAVMLFRWPMLGRATTGKHLNAAMCTTHDTVVESPPCSIVQDKVLDRIRQQPTCDTAAEVQPPTWNGQWLAVELRAREKKPRNHDSRGTAATLTRASKTQNVYAQPSQRICNRFADDMHAPCTVSKMLTPGLMT